MQVYRRCIHKNKGNSAKNFKNYERIDGFSLTNDKEVDSP